MCSLMPLAAGVHTHHQALYASLTSNAPPLASSLFAPPYLSFLTPLVLAASVKTMSVSQQSSVTTTLVSAYLCQKSVKAIQPLPMMVDVCVLIWARSA